jgi:GTPase SAR1 family protein
MNTIAADKLAGHIMLVGNVAVGKTTVSRVLALINNGELPNADLLKSIKKTNNMEYEFITSQQEIGDTHYSITMQFLVPPGQKKDEGDASGRSFEEVIDIFRSTIQRLDVVLFTYDMVQKQSFHDLEYWINGVEDLLNDATHFILLGTHLDRGDELEVTQDEIEEGLKNLADGMRSMRPAWKGNFARLEISNLTGENMESLLYYLAGSIISSRKMEP